MNEKAKGDTPPQFSVTIGEKQIFFVAPLKAGRCISCSLGCSLNGVVSIRFPILGGLRVLVPVICAL